MAIKIIKQEDGTERKISDSYSVLNLLTATDSNSVSLVISTAKNHVETTKTISDRVYYILEGELIIDNELIAKKEMLFLFQRIQNVILKGVLGLL